MIAAFVRMLTKQSLLVDIAVSCYRALVGFFIAAAMAVPLGILVGNVSSFNAFFGPITSFLRYLPVPALVPLFILWFGVGDLEKLVIIVVGVFFQLLLMVSDISAQVSQDYIEVCYTLGGKQKNALMDVIVPASLPGIVDSLRITMGWAWAYLIVAEVVGAHKGLGFVVMKSMRYLLTADVMVGIATFGILGIAFDLAFKLIYRIWFPWSPKI